MNPQAISAQDNKNQQIPQPQPTVTAVDKTFSQVDRWPKIIIVLGLAALIIVPAAPAKQRLAGYGVVLAIAVFWQLMHYLTKVTFTADGRLIIFHNEIKPEQLAFCRYSFVPPIARGLTGNGAFGWNLPAFCFYTTTKTNVSIFSPPNATITTFGWGHKKRKELFCMLKKWLTTTDVALDSRTQKHLDKLAGV